MCRTEANGVINIRAWAPSKGQRIIYQKPSHPTKTKKLPTFFRQQYVVVATLIIQFGLIVVGRHVKRDIRDLIKRDMRSIHPQIQESFIMAHSRLRWLNGQGHY